VEEPQPRKGAYENVEMYKRNISDKFVTITVVPISDNTLYLILNRITTTYIPNPFNTHLPGYIKSDNSNRWISDGSSNSTEDGYLPDNIFTASHVKTERRAVSFILRQVAKSIYCTNSQRTDYYSIVYGSLWHVGFVNTLFGYIILCRRDIKMLKSHLETIGASIFNVHSGIKALSNLKSTNTNVCNKSIYKNDFSISFVRQICTYCNVLFGSDVYEIAKIFEKNDPNIFVRYGLASSDKTIGRQCMFKAGYIYAELDNYKKANEMFKVGLSMCYDHDGTYIDKLKKLEEYYKIYDTTILFSI